MKYMGSKSRIEKHILPIMLQDAHENNIQTWVEPFVGGGNIIDKVPSSMRRIGCDLNPHTIAAMIAVRDFPVDLPEFVSKDEYLNLKGTDPSPITSWIRFVCSFGAKFENGYVSNKNGRDYAGEGKRNAIKQSKLIQDVEFLCIDYSQLDVKDCLIYCDPPYQGTTGYKTGAFDHEKFFDWCRKMKDKGNLVYVSEYAAPEDFTCVWQGEIKTSFASQRVKATHTALEKLFKV